MCDGVVLPSGDVIRSLTYNETHNYLGVMESCDIDHNKLVRQRVAAEYKYRLRLILSSQLSSNCKFKTINAFALPVIWYTAAIIQ